jgi:hypothetical protein
VTSLPARRPSSTRRRPLPSPLNAARDLLRVLRRRGVKPLRLAAVIACWLFALPVAWVLLHPDTVSLAEQGNALWMDGHAYWAVWRHASVYGLAPRAIDAYLYSPAFAQLLWPLTLLPFAGFAVAWWLVIVTAFLWLLHPLPWYWRGPAFVVTGYELQVGNVHALLAVMVVLGLRWPAAWSFALLTKVTPAVGLLWFAARGEWRSVARVAAFTSVVVAASAVAAPHLWADWLLFLLESRNGAAARGALNAGSLPLRLASAAVLVVWGARRNRPWVLAIAVPLATPLIGLATLTVLSALPRLVLISRAGSVQGRSPSL